MGAAMTLGDEGRRNIKGQENIILLHQFQGFLTVPGFIPNFYGKCIF